MRTIALLAVIAMLCPTLVMARATDSLAQAKQKFSAGDPIGAEELLQQVVESSDCTAVEVEEALFWQLMIYSGDFLSSLALLQSMANVGGSDGKLKRHVAQQMGLSRWAFFVASGNYLNNTVTGGELASVKLELPEMDDQGTRMLLSTLADQELMTTILADFESDPAVGLGLVERTNQYSLYLAIADGLEGVPKHDFSMLRRRVADSEKFNQVHFLDWMARVALDMDSLINEPDGPDLPGIQQRCDKRIIALVQGDTSNPYYIEAQRRSSAASE